MNLIDYQKLFEDMLAYIEARPPDNMHEYTLPQCAYEYGFAQCRERITEWLNDKRIRNGAVDILQ